MNIKQVLKWTVGYEAITWLLIWINLRSPWVDPMDGSTRPTTAQVIQMTHLFTFGFLVATIIFLAIFKRVWRASNHRR